VREKNNDMTEHVRNALLVVLVCSPVAGGATRGSATAIVRVRVERTVSVGVIAGAVDAGVVDTGAVTARVGFRVEANSPSVTLYVEATGLHKAGDANAAGAAAIPIDRAAGVVIAPTDAAPAGRTSNVATWSESTAIDGMPAEKSEAIRFASSQSGNFSQDVHVTVTWDQSDPEKPVGMYTGRVRLTAMVLP